ncbi:MAG: type II secretion system protein GspD [Desulfobacteraceae bacterium]|nr:MAG: type II secretion system protein GspD [Desulfobacteraceae bacterium]
MVHIHRAVNTAIAVWLIMGSAVLTDIPCSRAEGSPPEKVAINFDNVDISVFIKFISQLTGKNFVVDNRIKGKVTIISPGKLTATEAYKVFESVLDIHGFSTVPSGHVIKIVPAAKAKSEFVDTGVVKDPQALEPSGSDRMATRIVPLEYARSDELKTLLSPLVPKGSVLLSYRDTNMLVITAPLSSIERLVRIIEVIDIKNIGKKITVVPVRHADAGKLAKNLTSVFTARLRDKKGRATANMMVNLVADERTNTIILLASKLETDRIVRLIDLLDQEVPKGEERIRVFYLEHADAESLVKVLQAIPAMDIKKETGKAKAPLLSQKVKVTADKSTNSLIIMADKEDYPVLEEVIGKLDIPRAMVYIECLIMEVNADRGLNIGTEWKVGEAFDNDKGVGFAGFGGTGDSGYTNLAGAGGGNYPKGFSVGVLGRNLTIGGVTFPSLQAVVQAYQSDKDVHILSTPQILTTENEEASITVGKNVPFQTRSAAESGTETYNSFEYKDVGISLKITPHISKDRLVRLDVHQKVTKLDTVNQNNPDRPTTLKREIETTIIVEDGSSVVIGGLIDESLTRTVSKVPCLGDVPLMGYAFKNESKGGERTNLYVFLTPRVLQTPKEAGAIYNEKQKEIHSIKKGAIRLYEEDGEPAENPVE